jgi:hypothetical protein
MARKKVSRNAPCPCGSGKKYRHCCYSNGFDYEKGDDGTTVNRLFAWSTGDDGLG